LLNNNNLQLNSLQKIYNKYLNSMSEHLMLALISHPNISSELKSNLEDIILKNEKLAVKLAENYMETSYHFDESDNIDYEGESPDDESQDDYEMVYYRKNSIPISLFEKLLESTNPKVIDALVKNESVSIENKRKISPNFSNSYFYGINFNESNSEKLLSFLAHDVYYNDDLRENVENLYNLLDVIKIETLCNNRYDYNIKLKNLIKNIFRLNYPGTDKDRENKILEKFDLATNLQSLLHNICNQYSEYFPEGTCGKVKKYFLQIIFRLYISAIIIIIL